MAQFSQFEEMRAVIARVVARTCPAWLDASRDDLVQTAMVRLIERLDGDEGNPGVNTSYLYRTAHSVLVDEIRRRRRRPEDSMESGPQLAAGAHSGPDASLESQRQASDIRHCLARLIENRRLAVTLHLEGHAVPEIAEILGWRRKKADNCVYRGLADLRACLEQKGYRP